MVRDYHGAMFMGMRSKTDIFNFLHNTTAPIVERVWLTDRDRVLDQARQIGSTIAAFDTGHNSVVDARLSTGVLVDTQTGLLMIMLVGSTGSSASREPMFLRAMLNILDGQSVDLAAVVVDYCASECASNTRAHRRKHGHCPIHQKSKGTLPTCDLSQAGSFTCVDCDAVQQSTCRALYDLWHGVKQHKQNFAKQVPDLGKELGAILTQMQVHATTCNKELTQKQLHGILTTRVRDGLLAHYKSSNQHFVDAANATDPADFDALYSSVPAERAALIEQLAGTSSDRGRVEIPPDLLGRVQQHREEANKTREKKIQAPKDMFSYRAADAKMEELKDVARALLEANGGVTDEQLQAHSTREGMQQLIARVLPDAYKAPNGTNLKHILKDEGRMRGVWSKIKADIEAQGIDVLATAPLTVAEASLVKALNDIETGDGASQAPQKTNLYGTFVSVNDIHTRNKTKQLNAKQYELVFKHLSVIPAAGVPKDCTLKAKLQRVYGTSIYAQAQEAIAIATDAVMGVRLRYTRQHGALVRTCAECGMGEFSEKWRIWWVTDGLLACKEHFNNKHDNCGKFLPYCRCGHGEAYEQDEKSWWSELAPSTGNPEGVQDRRDP